MLCFPWVFWFGVQAQKEVLADHMQLVARM
jgi:hypothetical protein